VQGGEGDFRSKGEFPQNRQFLRGIAPIDVHGGIGFRVPQFLRLFQGFVVGLLLLDHLGQDEVAGAVQNRGDGSDLIGRHALRDDGDDRDASRDGGFKSDRPAQFLRTGEQFGAVFA